MRGPIDRFAPVGAKPRTTPRAELEKGSWMNLLLRPVRSSLGSKFVMAITGLGLTAFVLGHMAGNLLIFASGDAINNYAAALKHNPGLLWTARIILLVIFLLHIWLGFSLTQSNSQARPVRYVYEDTVEASWASRHMFLTGLLLLGFVIYHLAHFTFGVIKPAHVIDWTDGKEATVDYLSLFEPFDPNQSAFVRRYYNVMPPANTPRPPALAKVTRQDVRTMVIAGFRNPWITLSYLVAMIFLWLHLWHGVTSLFQSLGISHIKYNGIIRSLGPLVSTLVLIGNCSIPLCIWLGLVK